MADISKIKLPNNSEYNIKDTNAIPKNTSGNTQMLRRPSSLQGANDVTIDSKINTLRANRLAFLPADQIIIEKTIDGGTTWTDAGVSDDNKMNLFAETRPSIVLPQIDGKKNPLCGLRITITAMKYNVPEGTAETEKYNYWNSNYIVSAERYNQLKEMYFWVSVSGGYMNVKVERARGSSSTTWDVAFNDSSFNMTGYSGNDFISFSQQVFGGGTTQVNNYWNYRITLMTDDNLPTGNYLTYTQSVYEIRGYGDTWWTKGNEYAANDKLFTHDWAQNAFFPGSIYPISNNAKTLGSNSNKWNSIYATNIYGALTGNVTGTASKATADASGNTITSTYSTKAETVTGVAWNSTNKKLTKTINGSTTDVVTAATLRTGLNVADGAEVNQNAFSNVKVGSTTVAADSKTDTLELVAGSNVTLTPDATNDKVTIAATDTTYESKTAASGGTDVSLVTTGEKYTWNNKSTVPTDHSSTATTYGTGNASKYGHLKLSASTSSTSGESGGIAATPSAVKTAKDRADEAYSKAATVESGLNGTLIYDHTYTISNGVATFTPHVYLKGEEVTTNYAVSCFTWKYKLADNVTGTPSYVNLTTNNDRTCTVTISSLGYGGYVLGEFTPPSS